MIYQTVNMLIVSPVDSSLETVSPSRHTFFLRPTYVGYRVNRQRRLEITIRERRLRCSMTKHPGRRTHSPLKQRILLDLLVGRATFRTAYISRPVARLQVVTERKRRRFELLPVRSIVDVDRSRSFHAISSAVSFRAIARTRD